LVSVLKGDQAMSNFLLYIFNFVVGLLIVLRGVKRAKVNDLIADNERLRQENIKLEKLLNL